MNLSDTLPDVIGQKPKYLRAPKSIGSQLQVKRNGGRFKAGLIKGVSVITRGEALGHGFWIDEVFLSQVESHINEARKGIKSRFTHPSLSGDGLGRFVGRIEDAVIEGDKVIADQHFSGVGHRTPDGDLAGYLIDLAESDPEAYGLSIAFDWDEDAVAEFLSENGGEYFESPDPLNVHNLPHARLSALVAVDAVDEPAANPNGLFHRGQEIAFEADTLAEFALGISSDKPDSCLGLDADRVRGFVARFLDSHNLELKEKQMSQENDTPTTPEATDANPENDTVETGQETDATQDVSAAADEADTSASEPLETAQLSQGHQFLAAFGEQGGVWFAEGKSFDECQGLFNQAQAKRIDELAAENEKLRQRLSATSGGELEPAEVLARGLEDGTPKARTLRDHIRMAGQT